MKRLQSLLLSAFHPKVVTRALTTAAFVGTLLVLINQGEHFWGGKSGDAFWVKAGLTFLVPYLVSTVSTVVAMADCQEDQ